MKSEKIEYDRKAINAHRFIKKRSLKFAVRVLLAIIGSSQVLLMASRLPPCPLRPAQKLISLMPMGSGLAPALLPAIEAVPRFHCNSKRVRWPSSHFNKTIRLTWTPKRSEFARMEKIRVLMLIAAFAVFSAHASDWPHFRDSDSERNLCREGHQQGLENQTAEGTYGAFRSATMATPGRPLPRGRFLSSIMPARKTRARVRIGFGESRFGNSSTMMAIKRTGAFRVQRRPLTTGNCTRSAAREISIASTPKKARCSGRTISARITWESLDDGDYAQSPVIDGEKLIVCPGGVKGTSWC